MAFWSQDFTEKGTLEDPLRKFRFLVSFSGITDPGNGEVLWYAKSAAKPSFKIGEAEHKYLNHTFYYPGGTTWDAIDVTLVDPVDPNISLTLASIVEVAGYNPPNAAAAVTPAEGAGAASPLGSMSKGKAAYALGTVRIVQLNSFGAAIEEWTLWNAWISALKFGDLEYGSDDLLDLTVSLRYDWARLENRNGGKGVATRAPDQTSVFEVK